MKLSETVCISVCVFLRLAWKSIRQKVERRDFRSEVKLPARTTHRYVQLSQNNGHCESEWSECAFPLKVTRNGEPRDGETEFHGKAGHSPFGLVLTSTLI